MRVLLIRDFIARLIVGVEYASSIGRLDMAGEEFGSQDDIFVDIFTGGFTSWWFIGGEYVLSIGRLDIVGE